MDETKDDRLERLEQALIDQKLRAERHRSNFEALKTEHLILQEVCQWCVATNLASLVSYVLWQSLILLFRIVKAGKLNMKH